MHVIYMLHNLKQSLTCTCRTSLRGRFPYIYLYEIVLSQSNGKDTFRSLQKPQKILDLDKLCDRPFWWWIRILTLSHDLFPKNLEIAIKIMRQIFTPQKIIIVLGLASDEKFILWLASVRSRLAGSCILRSKLKYLTYLSRKQTLVEGFTLSLFCMQLGTCLLICL